jgi:hypothetical protein
VKRTPCRCPSLGFLKEDSKFRLNHEGRGQEEARTLHTAAKRMLGLRAVTQQKFSGEKWMHLISSTP